jgi:hypothetical protein
MELYRKSEAKQEQHIAAHAQDLNTHVHILAAVAEAFLQAEAEGLDPFQTVYRSVPKAVVITTVQQARAIARPPTFDYLDLLEPKYLPLRQALLRFYRTLPFQPFRRRDPAILALEDALTHKNRAVRRGAIHALGHIGGEQARAAIVGRQTDRSKEVRAEIDRALHMLERPADTTGDRVPLRLA